MQLSETAAVPPYPNRLLDYSGPNLAESYARHRNKCDDHSLGGQKPFRTGSMPQDIYPYSYALVPPSCLVAGSQSRWLAFSRTWPGHPEPTEAVQTCNG